MIAIFAQTLRLLRKESGLTQSELAKKLGKSASAIGMYEQGRREPDTKTLRRIRELFGVPVDLLIDGAPRTVFELPDVLEGMTQSLLKHPGLTFNGEPLGRGDLAEVCEAMRLGMLLALRGK